MNLLALAGINTAGQVVSSGLNYYSQMQTNAQNKALQETEWSREDTAMQRKVADLKAAGLNPVLAAQGSGSPTSLAVRMQAPQFELPDIGKAMSLAMLGSQFKEAAARADEAQANAENARALAEFNKERERYKSTLVQQEIEKNAVGIGYQSQESENARWTGDLLKKENDFYIAGNIAGILQKLLPGLSTVTDLMRGSKLPMGRR